MEVLLEVVAQREVEEGPVVGRELHRGGQPALDDGQVAHGEVAVEGGHVGAHLDAVGGGQRRRVDAGPSHHDHPELGHGGRGEREGLDDPA